MSKSLRSMTKEERLRAINRRLEEKHGGLGYWAAVDAQKNRVSESKKHLQDVLKDAQ